MTAAKHFLIGGGSGFIGRALTRVLEARGERVTLISRFPGRNRMTWDDVKANGLPACDVVINLAGKHILDPRRRWTERYREEIIRSRVETTRILVDAINAAPQPPPLFISTAGKCFYGSQAFRQSEQYFDLDERSSPIGIDYPASLVSQWEAAADRVDSTRVRHVKLRLGIVLASDDEQRPPGRQHLGARGVFPLLAAAFRRGFCVRMGSGVQPFPWVHIDDVVGIFLKAIDDQRLKGVFNAVSPGIVSNGTFTRLLARKLRRPVLGGIPAWLIKLIVGRDRSTILLLGQRIRPTRTLEYGYRFRFDDLDDCLDHLLLTAREPLRSRALSP
ncbi:MAG: TIGR01777 family oxidoreductase [Pseudomonadota bacterium]